STLSPAARSASASRSSAMIWSGVCRLRFMTILSGFQAVQDSHSIWISFRGADQHHQPPRKQHVENNPRRFAALRETNTNHTQTQPTRMFTYVHAWLLSRFWNRKGSVTQSALT